MKKRSDEDLLQRALDGAAGEDELARLRARMKGDPQLTARADRLEQLASLLRNEEPSAPPVSFTEDVMNAVASAAAQPARPRLTARAHQLFEWFTHHFGQATRGSESAWTAGWAGGGAVVAKKALWAVAGLALAVILIVVYYNGTRSVNGGAEGTIGAAARYRGAQPSNKDVVADQAAAQKFLQSDVFDRLIKDEKVRSLLSNRELCALVAGGGVQAALNDREVEAALKNDAVEAALKDPTVMAALEDRALIAALQGDAMRALMQDQAASALFQRLVSIAGLKDNAALAALRNPDVQRALVQTALKEPAAQMQAQASLARSNAALLAALKNPAFAQLVGDRTFQAALQTNSGFASLMGDDRFQAALQSDKFAGLFGNERFQAALRQAGFARMISSDVFEAALQAGLARLIANDSFMAALHNENFMALVGRDSGFNAALRSDAMQAALNAR